MKAVVNQATAQYKHSNLMYHIDTHACMSVLEEPWLGFWLPIAILCISVGFWLTDRKDWRHRLPILTSITALSIIGIHGATTRGEDSPETALLAVLLRIAGPVSMMALGSLIAIFSGPSPVGPLPKFLRPMGFLLAYGGLFWVGWILISKPSSAIANGIGEIIWSTWVNVFLSMMILVSALAGSFCIVMGERRQKEATILAALTIAGGFMFWTIMKDGSGGLDAAGWHEIHWNQMMVVIGGLFGMITASIGFVYLVVMAERRQPDPDVVAPLSEEEKSVVDAVLRLHLDNLEDE